MGVFPICSMIESIAIGTALVESLFESIVTTGFGYEEQRKNVRFDESAWHRNRTVSAARGIVQPMIAGGHVM